MARLLIVDEVETERGWMRRILEAAQHAVAEARYSAEALNWLREQPGRVDLVIAALHTPVVSGIELIRSLRALRPPVKILAVAGDEPPDHSADEALLFSQVFGADAILYTPFTGDELLTTVARLLG
jgi:CheY-like chemotaxis protein